MPLPQAAPARDVHSTPRNTLHHLALLAIALLPAALLPTPLPAAPTPAAATPFTYEDIFRLRSAHNVQISPDGHLIAYTVSSIDRENDRSTTSLWLLHTANRQTSQISTDTGSAAWSPDSKQFAFSQSDPNGKPSLVIADAANPQQRRVFSVPSQPDNLVWSPDKHWIAMTLFVPDTNAPSFLSTAINQAEASLAQPSGAHWAAPLKVTQTTRYQADGSGDLSPGHTHLFVLSTETGQLRQVVHGPYSDRSPSWTPDSAHILFAANRDPANTTDVGYPAIQTVDLATGTIVQLTHDLAFHGDPVASPDGQWIAYTDTPARPVNYTVTSLFIMHPDGSGQRRLAPHLDRDIFGPRWSSDGASIYASYDNQSLARVGRFHLDGTMEEVAAGTQFSFSVSNAGDVAYSGSTIDRPAEVFLARPPSATLSLTSLNPFLSQRTFGRLLHLEVPSPTDHASIDTWVLLPPGASSTAHLPTILTLHGGPFGFEDASWSTTYQLFAAAGYAVVFPNYRGSTSFGTSFSEPANVDFPNCAVAGLMRVMDALVQQGIADPNRLFVTGGSAGGELTAWIVGKTNRFRAAVAEKPVINQLSEALATDQYPYLRLSKQFPWAMEPAFWARSPLSLVGSVATPTLLLTGEQDHRTPLNETLQFYDALQIRAVPSALVRVPGAGHESLRSRPSQLVAETAATLAWFHHYDHPAPTPAPGSPKP